MNTPKMLPWLAGTAGIDLERAEQLWQLASDYAESVTGESESSRYLSIAHEQMIALVEKEVLAESPIQDAPWLMIQAHLSVAPMIVADTFAQAAVATRQAIGRWTEKHQSAA
ncbi:protein of unknown function [Georgfuchsia toluolica]|uniref:Uncharacterized protein n=1 Tax=Georgfuchsia toluolica TaxID=424218 RepID=A0A916N1G1_9PROT|nr:hypothetical protein [Georgfuchsia toluolica]CAG4884890.1 protein of unknown function [Georgfuchsia toluolica]